MHFSHFLSIFLYIYIFLALFTFVSRRHRGSPSGLTFYVDGIQNIRLMHFSHFLSIYSALFTFVSRRHRGSPFGLTFYIDGIQNIRLSSCCEYKHRPGHKVGGKNSQFGLVAVQGAAPCYKYVLFSITLILALINLTGAAPCYKYVLLSLFWGTWFWKTLHKHFWDPPQTPRSTSRLAPICTLYSLNRPPPNSWQRHFTT